MRDRVSVGTCGNPAEAALVRAAFGAHGIEVLINAETHANMLGGMGGAFLPLHIFVSKDDAEEAAALLADLRAQNRSDELEGASDPVEDAEYAEEIERRRRRFRLGIIVMFVVPYAFVLPVIIERPLVAASVAITMFAAMVA